MGEFERHKEIEEKIKYILIEISKQNNNESAEIDILTYSEFYFERHWNYQTFPNAYNLELKVTPDAFTKHFSKLGGIGETIRKRINASSGLIIDKIKIVPDYNRLEVINAQVFPIYTEWEEINRLQPELIESLKRAKTTIDFQNIGNAARVIIDKVARQVFDIDKHKPNNPTIAVNPGKFKNQLHSYIDKVLAGENNKEFRKLANSSIDFVEDACDLMSTTTHKLDAERHLAEVCVISTVSAISIIKLINQLEDQE